MLFCSSYFFLINCQCNGVLALVCGFFCFLLLILFILHCLASNLVLAWKKDGGIITLAVLTWNAKQVPNKQLPVGSKGIGVLPKTSTGPLKSSIVECLPYIIFSVEILHFVIYLINLITWQVTEYVLSLVVFLSRHFWKVNLVHKSQGLIG